MRLTIELEMVNMGDEIIAVPVGKNAKDLHGVLKMNHTGCEVINLLRKEDITVDEIVDLLSRKYENDKSELLSYVQHVIDALKNIDLIE